MELQCKLIFLNILEGIIKYYKVLTKNILTRWNLFEAFEFVCIQNGIVLHCEYIEMINTLTVCEDFSIERRQILMLARWCTQPIKFRVQDRQRITERLQSISMRSILREFLKIGLSIFDDCFQSTIC